MGIRCDWDIRFDAEDYLAQVGGNLKRLLARPAVWADWQAALADARALVQPAAIWEAFALRDVRPDRM